MVERRTSLDFPLSRRAFLQKTGLLALATSFGVTGCFEDDTLEPEGASRVPGDQSKTYDLIVPPAPDSINRGTLRFFTPREARFIEAMTARIIPGTPEDPGAREADVTTFIDVWLSVNQGYWEPTYREPPFALSEDGGQDDGGSEATDLVIRVPEDELERYGYQSIVTPAEAFRLGIAITEAYCQQSFGGGFTSLTEEHQDSVIEALSNEEVSGFNQPSAESFFRMVRRETINGMFSDPAYGGNRDKVGWLLLDYPGAQRGYSPAEMQTESNNREPKSLAELEVMNPGQHHGPNTITPLQSAEEHRH